MTTVRTWRIALASAGAGALAAMVLAAVQTAGAAGDLDSLKASGSNATAYSTPTYTAPHVPEMALGGTVNEVTTTIVPSP